MSRALPTLCGGLSAQHQPMAALCPGGTPQDPSSCPEPPRAAPPARALLGGEGVPSPLRKVLKNCCPAVSLGVPSCGWSASLGTPPCPYHYRAYPLGPLTTAGEAHTQACPGNICCPQLEVSWHLGPAIPVLQGHGHNQHLPQRGGCRASLESFLPLRGHALWTGVPALWGWHSSWETAQIMDCSSPRGLGWALLVPPPRPFGSLGVGVSVRGPTECPAAWAWVALSLCCEQLFKPLVLSAWARGLGVPAQQVRPGCPRNRGQWQGTKASTVWSLAARTVAGPLISGDLRSQPKGLHQR